MARPFKYTVEEVRKAVDELIADCNKTKKIPTRTGLAIKLNLHLDTLTDWKKQEGYSEQLKRIDKLQEEELIQRVAQGSKPIGPMFLLKTNHGYIEKQHVEHSGTLNMAHILDTLESEKEKRVLGTDEYKVLGE